MSESANTGNNNLLYFIVGGLVVVIAGIGFLYFGGHLPGSSAKLNVTIEAPKTTP